MIAQSKLVAARCVQLLVADPRFGQERRLAEAIGCRRSEVARGLRLAAADGLLESVDAGRTWRATEKAHELVKGPA